MKNLVLAGILGLGMATPVLAEIRIGEFQCGAPGAIKLFHVSGQRICQSHENLGYRVAVEVRDATDCQNGHMRNQQGNPCGTWNSNPQTNGRPIGYEPGGCSPLW